ncbi:MAG: hypothetical protein P8Z79_18270, partial [Sedimentisphaerales bacterium]
MLVLFPYLISCAFAPARDADPRPYKPFTELVFIDHVNLRYVEGSERARAEAEQAKRNIDKAAQYGIDCYLLFAKESMEAILTYDFDVPSIGNIGRQAFQRDSKHRRT